MARRLPPLNALRAFEAAARHLSFTKAAQELHVTQAAISHQVKGLEEILGIQLFRRLNRRLALTEAGQDYLPPLRDAFDAIAAATQRLHEREEGSALKISVLLSFASAWLLPRLSAFRRLHPEIDILVTAGDTLVDFELDDFDMGIRYGLGSYPGLRVDLLMGDEVYPVCSPKLLDGPHPLRRPADLEHHTLLHDTVQGTPDDPDWRLWLRQAGVEGVDPTRGPGFSHGNFLLSAAVAGEGVALLRRSLVADDIKARRLICPFGPIFPTRFVYSLVAPPHKAEIPKVVAFRDWISAEVGAFLESAPQIGGSPSKTAEPS